MEVAREKRARLGTRHGPAPSTRQGEPRRHAKTARAAAAMSAQKADVRSGDGAVMSSAGHVGVATVVMGARERRAQSARGTGRRRARDKGEQRRRASTARAATATSAQQVDALLGGGAVMGIAKHAR